MSNLQAALLSHLKNTAAIVGLRRATAPASAANRIFRNPT
jgi:hypothetical protein